MKINKSNTIWNQLEDTNIYVSECGRVKRVNEDTEKELPQVKKGAGYLAVSIDGKSIYVHRLVIMSSFGITREFLKQSKLQVNHRNGNKRDNRVENLELMTGSRNITHSVREGLRKPMDNTSWTSGRPCYFSDEQVAQMRAMYATGGYKQVDLARLFDTIQPTVSRMVRGVYRASV